jgi:hypothetical protein
VDKKMAITDVHLVQKTKQPMRTLEVME